MATPPSSLRAVHRKVAAGGLGGLAKQRQAEPGLLAGLGREEGVGRLLGAHVEARARRLRRRSTARRAAARPRRARRPCRRPRAASSRSSRGRRATGHASATILPWRWATASTSSAKVGASRRERGGHAADVFEVVAVGRAHHRQPVLGTGGRRRGAGRRVARQLDGVEAGLERKEAELGDDPKVGRSTCAATTRPPKRLISATASSSPAPSPGRARGRRGRRPCRRRS